MAGGSPGDGGAAAGMTALAATGGSPGGGGVGGGGSNRSSGLIPGAAVRAMFGATRRVVLARRGPGVVLGDDSLRVGEGWGVSPYSVTGFGVG